MRLKIEFGSNREYSLLDFDGDVFTMGRKTYTPADVKASGGVLITSDKETIKRLKELGLPYKVGSKTPVVSVTVPKNFAVVREEAQKQGMTFSQLVNKLVNIWMTAPDEFAEFDRYCIEHGANTGEELKALIQLK